MDAYEASIYTETPARLFIRLCVYGNISMYRVTTPTLIGDGVHFEGLSLDNALNDDDYSALWSSTSLQGWLPLRKADNSAYDPDRWAFDTNQAVGVVAKKNEKYANGGGNTTLGAIYRTVPPDSSRNAVVAQMEWEFLAPDATWGGGIIYGNADFTGLANLITPLAGSGVKQTGAVCAAFPSSALFGMQLYYNNPNPTLYIGETGDCYFRFTRVRLATSTTNMIATTITSGAIAVGAASPTVGSVANMYVGQRLVINSGAADSESVIVTAVGATTFTATFSKAHAANATVRAIVIYDDEIIKDMHARALALNPSSGLKPSTALVQSSGRDRMDKEWHAAQPLRVMEELAKPVLYDYGVTGDGLLFYQPRGTNARAWMVRASDIELARPLAGVVNSVRAAYQNAANQLQVTAYATDTVSVASNGLTRRRTIQADTTSPTEAALIRDTALSDTKKRPVQSRVSFRRLYDRSGAEYPPDQVQRGDTITIANLPAVFFSSQLRTFRVAETHIDVNTGLPSVTPEAPLPLLDVLLARLAEG
jgi:hypothetical protein